LGKFEWGVTCVKRQNKCLKMGEGKGLPTKPFKPCQKRMGTLINLKGNKSGKDWEEI